MSTVDPPLRCLSIHQRVTARAAHHSRMHLPTSGTFTFANRVNDNWNLEGNHIKTLISVMTYIAETEKNFPNDRLHSNEQCMAQCTGHQHHPEIEKSRNFLRDGKILVLHITNSSGPLASGTPTTWRVLPRHANEETRTRLLMPEKTLQTTTMRCTFQPILEAAMANPNERRACHSMSPNFTQRHKRCP